MRKVITIDGLAASGKSSLGLELARRIKYKYLNSGLIYRILGYLVVKSSTDQNSEKDVFSVLQRHELVFGEDEKGANRGFLDGNDVTEKLFDPSVSECTSIISKFQQVRAALLSLQQNAFPGQDLVAEGRDMGTVVFPNAPLKFFIECNVETRVERRIKQIASQQKLSLEELKVLKQKMEIEVIERDKRDKERKESPTVAAKDAIVIINSGKTLTEVVESMYDFVAKYGLLK
jgi:CMP/dCMP kinase